MCRNIKLLYNFQPPATPEEVHASALQYVRKVSGMREPSAANRPAFEQAVADITRVTLGLLQSLETRSAPKSREEEARKARERGAKRDARMRSRVLEELGGT